MERFREEMEVVIQIPKGEGLSSVYLDYCLVESH